MNCPDLILTKSGIAQYPKIETAIAQIKTGKNNEP
jgi:hypothetical protein